jgi:uncharacterized membrane protein
VLAGEFCHHCGQKSGPRVLPVRDMAAGLADDLLSLDARIVRTLRGLLFRPGFLTREYLAGRRVGYVPPFRLYLLVSAVNLALTAALQTNSFFFFSATPGAHSARVIALLPRVMFVLLPAFAAILAVVYRGRFFAEHFVFALHFHSAAFLLASAHILLVAPEVGLPKTLVPAARFVDALLQIAVLAHLYLSLRRAYGRSRLATAASMAAVLAGYSLALLAALTVTVQLVARLS